VDTLAAFVAWICCERLRVATCGLRENFRNSYRLSTGASLCPIVVILVTMARIMILEIVVAMTMVIMVPLYTEEVPGI
jgi:Flp pilus assembly protein TadB